MRAATESNPLTPTGPESLTSAGRLDEHGPSHTLDQSQGAGHSPDGVWVPPERLEPGDLVFFTGTDGTHKAPGHVGIYVGDGYLIDAPHTGSFVRIDSLDERWFANKYVGAKRILSVSIDTRHLLHVSGSAASATAIRAAPPPITIEPLGQSLGVAIVSMAAPRIAPRGHWIWTVVALAALFLLLLAGGLLLLLAGGLVVRRRRSAAGLSIGPSA